MMAKKDREKDYLSTRKEYDYKNGTANKNWVEERKNANELRTILLQQFSRMMAINEYASPFDMINNHHYKK